MIEAMFALAGAWIGMELGRFLTVRIERDRNAAALAAERQRVDDLTKLLMSREAPAEYAAYVTPQLPKDEFPADAIWDDSGLYYAVPESD